MKYCTTILALLLVFAVLSPVAVCAQEQDSTAYITYDDGSYIAVEVTVIQSRASSTRIAAKHYTYYNSNDVKQWKATVTGTFAYDGTTSQCTAVSTNFTVYNSEWSLDSVTKNKSGSRAFADFYISYAPIIGVSFETSVRVTVTCDKDGNVT